METAFTWHVVSSADGLILSVWGGALLADAQESARRIQQQTLRATYLHQIVTTMDGRPCVGGTISMRGFIRDGVQP